MLLSVDLNINGWVTVLPVFQPRLFASPLRSLFLGFFLSLTLGFLFSLALGFFLSLALGFLLHLTFGFLLHLTFGLLFGLTFGFLLRLTFCLLLGFSLSCFFLRLALSSFLLRLTLCLTFGNFALSDFTLRCLLARYLALLRDLSLRSFFTRLLLGSHNFLRVGYPALSIYNRTEKSSKSSDAVNIFEIVIFS